MKVNFVGNIPITKRSIECRRLSSACLNYETFSMSENSNVIPCTYLQCFLVSVPLYLGNALKRDLYVVHFVLGSDSVCRFRSFPITLRFHSFTKSYKST